MKINLALWDRLLRFLFGVILMAWAIAGGPWWGFLGAYLIITSAWGLCPAYSILKIRTAPAEHSNYVPPE